MIEIDDDGLHDFLYVSLVTDKNTNALYRTQVEYNLYGYPTVYFDGGYRVVVGAGSVPQAKSNYINAINQCSNRAVPDIEATLNVDWVEDPEMDITVSVQNNEPTQPVDNEDPYFQTLSGTWKSIAHENAHDGTTRYNAPGSGEDQAGWRIDTFIEPGTYEVYVWKFEHALMHLMSSNTPYRVKDKNGMSDWIYVDQSTAGNEWISLGTFEFDNSTIQGVLITDAADGYVIADAIKLAKHYEGHIRVFVNEIESSMGWNDSWGVPYTYPFLDYAFNQSISVPAGETWQSSMTWNGNDYNDGHGHTFGDITQDNTIVMAAVYNDEWHQGYSYPPRTNPFDAYYVDEAVAATPNP